jgi:hypothetical protein
MLLISTASKRPSCYARLQLSPERVGQTRGAIERHVGNLTRFAEAEIDRAKQSYPGCWLRSASSRTSTTKSASQRRCSPTSKSASEKSEPLPKTPSPSSKPTMRTCWRISTGHSPSPPT